VARRLAARPYSPVFAGGCARFSTIVNAKMAVPGGTARRCLRRMTHGCRAQAVIAGLDPAIQPVAKSWMPGSSPDMTADESY
jgi:hypothetical protein